MTRNRYGKLGIEIEREIEAMGKEEEGDSGIKMKCNVVMESKKKGKDNYDFTSYTVLKVKKIAG